MIQGPNVKKLIATRMAKDAIPDGGGFADGIKFLSDPEELISGAKKATGWVQLAIRAVREAKNPNPWTKSTDEEIAGEILKQIESRKAKAAGEEAGK